MFDVSIGAVTHANVLTIAVRDGRQLALPEQHKIATALDAVPILLELKFKHRHDDPVVYLESSSTAGAVLDGIKSRDARSRDQIVNGLAASGARVGSTTVEFADKRSELHYRLRERVSQGALLVPSAYAEDLTAFTEGVKNGRVFFDYITDVAATLGRWPALAVAAVLANIEPPRRHVARVRHQDPLESMYHHDR